MRRTLVSFQNYREKYETIRFDRQDGILQMQLHTDGGEYVNSATAHSEIADAFNQIGADHENRIVILTGTGDNFGVHLDGATFFDRQSKEGELSHDERIARIHYEGRRIMQAVLDVEAPMIAAINGSMSVLPPFALTCDITLCTEDSTFSDRVHFHDNSSVPGDGVHVVWQQLLGVNRGRYLLLTGQELTAQEALQLGVVNEVLERDSLLPRAQQLAEQLNRKPKHVLRYSRLVLNQRYRRAVFEDTAFGYGMQWLGSPKEI